MKQHTKIAILGGGGRTGKFLVTQLIDQGYRLKLLLRNPEQFTIHSPLIEVLKGDAVDSEAIHALLEGCEAVMSTVGQRKGEPLVSSQATTHLLQSMTIYGIRRYIVVAGLNLDTPFDKKSEKTRMATEWMKANYPIVHADRKKAYSILSASAVDWTVVRVPLIVYSDTKGELLVDLEDCKGDTISAAAIGAFLIEQLSDTTYFRKSPFIANP
ncbi:MAG: NAD(P)H-binding protein [Maribacter sp.]|nr:NAD(P)H-binding protein [Maribacter sp.]